MVDLVFNEIYPKGESYPFIVNFQNGNPTSDFKEQNCNIYINDGNKKVIALDINNILYHGEENEEPLQKNLILARNRQTGKVRLIEVENIDLKPHFKSGIDTAEAETSFVDLGRKFGSKRHKKILEQNEKLKVNEDVVKDQLKDVSQNISQDQLDLSAHSPSVDSDNFYIPPINREATAVEDVYALHALLSEDEYDTIFKELDMSDYKSNLHPLIKEIATDKWTKEQVVLAVYASSLLNTYSKTMKETALKKFAPCLYSSLLNDIILKQFFTYNGSSRGRPLTYKDKMLCHAIVYTLLINNYKLDVEKFASVMKLAEHPMAAKINMTGATIIKQGSEKKRVATLKLPLNKLNSFKRRKSRI